MKSYRHFILPFKYNIVKNARPKHEYDTVNRFMHMNAC